MSDQFPPPQGGPQQPGQPGQFAPAGYGDAKAAAKAAKAYAKAQRPWFRKKRWIAAGALGVVVIATAVGGGGGASDDDTAADGTSQSSGAGSGSDGTVTPVDDVSPAADKPAKAEKPAKAAKVGTKKNPAPLGRAAGNDSARYTITKVAVRDSLGQMVPAPSGRYVVVTVQAENVKDKTIQISSGDFVLQVGGNEIEASDNAIFLDGAFSYEDLSPGLKRTGTIVFDVAPGDAGKGVVKAQAMLSLDDAVYLSLTR